MNIMRQRFDPVLTLLRLLLVVSGVVALGPATGVMQPPQVQAGEASAQVQTRGATGLAVARAHAPQAADPATDLAGLLSDPLNIARPQSHARLVLPPQGAASRPVAWLHPQARAPPLA